MKAAIQIQRGNLSISQRQMSSHSSLRRNCPTHFTYAATNPRCICSSGKELYSEKACAAEQKTTEKH
ncbi:hypothetical protein AOXY_G7880 [Acipenser oxyrinchus oxyrinchus]|uniref:Uncharacterized protein n=1 Tax=Acipenser oxyrinchus oxyrinchus TaxID=40147 RepID=A0AAD8GAQ6_ACIOX|nr:hypothetical protein AOXY_G7880 [Acipenser oxyrinchus oxyrinchus]